MSFYSLQSPGRQTLYEAALKHGMTLGPGYTSTGFSKTEIQPKELEKILGTEKVDLIRKVWAHTRSFTDPEGCFDTFWSGHIASMVDHGWCYGLSCCYLLSIMENPGASVEEVMQDVDLGEAVVFQATQAVTARLAVACGRPKLSRAESDRIWLQNRILGQVRSLLSETLSTRSPDLRRLQKVARVLKECLLKEKDCVAARLSISGYPGHSVVCQFHPVMRIFDASAGIYEFDDKQKFLMVLKIGLMKTLKTRKSDSVDDVLISIIGYYSNLE